MEDNASVFSEIVSGELQKLHDTLKGNYHSSSCEDMWVSVVRGNSSNNFNYYRNITLLNLDISLIFILILESPHKDEYNKKLSSPEPAAKGGPTWTNIESDFAKIMAEQIGEKSSFYIYLFNAIQYQCSLGSTCQMLKKAIFDSAWKSFGRERFLGRLDQLRDSLQDNNVVFINACTKPFKRKVTDGVKSFIIKNKIKETDCPFFSTAHPSSVWFGKNGAKKISIA
nr:hypothetical protein [uncultured Dethiosulfovibrio sp.]